MITHIMFCFIIQNFRPIYEHYAGKVVKWTRSFVNPQPVLIFSGHFWDVTACLYWKFCFETLLGFGGLLNLLNEKQTEMGIFRKLVTTKQSWLHQN